jgi:hypothetical protein
MKSIKLESTHITLLDQGGALHVVMMIALMELAGAGFGVWGLLRHWRGLTETQLRLDRCVGKSALELKHTLVQIEEGNTTIRVLRAAVAVATPLGHGAEPRALLEVAVRGQDLLLVRWQARRAEWLARRGCGEGRDLPYPLPSMSWVRPPEDLIGPQALSWEPGVPRSLRVQLVHLPRAAAARVEAQPLAGDAKVIGKLGFNGKTNWKASWAVPKLGAVGAGID